MVKHKSLNFVYLHTAFDWIPEAVRAFVGYNPRDAHLFFGVILDQYFTVLTWCSEASISLSLYNTRPPIR